MPEAQYAGRRGGGAWPLYREARRGEVTVSDASKLATILAILRMALEADDLEARVAEPERAIGGGK